MAASLALVCQFSGEILELQAVSGLPEMAVLHVLDSYMLLVGGLFEDGRYGDISSLGPYLLHPSVVAKVVPRSINILWIVNNWFYCGFLKCQALWRSIWFT